MARGRVEKGEVVSDPTDTPRTNAVLRAQGSDGRLIGDLLTLARQLERELNEAEARIARLKEVGSGLLDYAETENPNDPSVVEWLQLVGTNTQ